MHDKTVDSLVIIIDKSGKTYYMGKVSDTKLHVEYLNDYLKKNYDGFDFLSDKGPVIETTDYLTKLGNVVFLNEKLFDVMFVPNDVNDRQVMAIDDLYILFGDVPVVLNQKPNMDLGYPLYQINEDEEYTLHEIADKYMNKVENSHLKK